uniref:Ubiquitin hydrolase n=1 Tax=Tanacetum cinerariifolium TaxID=118510 RepID=A0A6L2KKY3_TANCI|nr:ubiquitin hydrolase [Tanacetum cinerariifolium]
MSDSTVTYTEVSSPFEGLSDIGSPRVNGLLMMPEDPCAYVEAALLAPPSPDYVPGPEHPPTLEFVSEPVYLNFMPPENDVLPAEEQPLLAADSPTADSPGYIPESGPEENPKEDDEDLEEDPADCPTDRDDDDDDEEEKSINEILYCLDSNAYHISQASNSPEKNMLKKCQHKVGEFIDIDLNNLSLNDLRSYSISTCTQKRGVGGGGAAVVTWGSKQSELKRSKELFNLHMYSEKRSRRRRCGCGDVGVAPVVMMLLVRWCWGCGGGGDDHGVRRGGGRRVEVEVVVVRGEDGGNDDDDVVGRSRHLEKDIQKHRTLNESHLAKIRSNPSELKRSKELSNSTIEDAVFDSLIEEGTAATNMNDYRLQDTKKHQMRILSRDRGLLSEKKDLNNLSLNDPMELFNLHSGIRLGLGSTSEKAKKERDELKLILEKLQNSSKSLNTLLESQVSDKDKTRLGYKAASSVVEGFVNSSKILEKQENKSDKGYHEVPPPFTGYYMPPKRDLRLIDEHFESASVDVSTVSSSDGKTVDVKGVVSKEEPKPVKKNNFSPIIEDWVFESEEENEPKFQKQVQPSFPKIEFVKAKDQNQSFRKLVKHVEQAKSNTDRPKGNKRNWNKLMNQRLGSNFKFKNKACYECGSFDHLIKDCCVHRKQVKNQKMEKPV